MKTQSLSRRHFLGLSLGAGALLLAGCGGGSAAPAGSPSTAAANPSSAPAGAGSASQLGSASASTAAAAPASAPATPAPASSTSGQSKPAASAAPGGAAAGNLQPLKVGTGAAVGSAGFFIANDRGYFKEEGLGIDIVPFAGAAEMATPLAAGQLDVINADPSTAFLNAYARGIHIRFVADGSRTTKGHSSAAMLVRKDLIDSGAIKTYSDLKGKSFNAVLKGSLVDMWAQRIVGKGNLKVSDVTLQYIPFADSVAAMGNKALDAGMNVEPLVTVAVGKGVAVRWKGMDEVFGDLQNTVIMYSANMATKNQDAGKRFMVGYLRGIRDFLDAFNGGKDKAAIIAILAKNTAVKDSSLYNRMSLATFDPNGRMLPQSMKDMQQWWVNHGYVKSPVNIDQVIDNTYIQYAVSKLGAR